MQENVTDNIEYSLKERVNYYKRIYNKAIPELLILDEDKTDYINLLDIYDGENIVEIRLDYDISPDLLLTMIYYKFGNKGREGLPLMKNEVAKLEENIRGDMSLSPDDKTILLNEFYSSKGKVFKSDVTADKQDNALIMSNIERERNDIITRMELYSQKIKNSFFIYSYFQNKLLNLQSTDKNLFISPVANKAKRVIFDLQQKVDLTNLFDTIKSSFFVPLIEYRSRDNKKYIKTFDNIFPNESIDYLRIRTVRKNPSLNEITGILLLIERRDSKISNTKLFSTFSIKEDSISLLVSDYFDGENSLVNLREAIGLDLTEPESVSIKSEFSILNFENKVLVYDDNSFLDFIQNHTVTIGRTKYNVWDIIFVDEYTFPLFKKKKIKYRFVKQEDLLDGSEIIEEYAKHYYIKSRFSLSFSIQYSKSSVAKVGTNPRGVVAEISPGTLYIKVKVSDCSDEISESDFYRLFPLIFSEYLTSREDIMSKYPEEQRDQIFAISTPKEDRWVKKEKKIDLLKALFPQMFKEGYSDVCDSNR